MLEVTRPLLERILLYKGWLDVTTSTIDLFVSLTISIPVIITMMWRIVLLFLLLITHIVVVVS